MSERGTLKELNVKPGDVVQYIFSGDKYTVASNECLIQPDGAVGHYQYWDTCSSFRLISRATDKPEPKRVTVPLMADFREIGTIDLIDGKPDFASIKLGDAEGGEA